MSYQSSEAYVTPEIFMLWNAHLGARPRGRPVAAGGGTSKRGPGGSKDAREATTPDSIFGDVPDLDSRKAAELAAGREKWKSLRPSKRC